VNDRSGLAVPIGIVGLVLGVLALVLDLPVLGLLAGVTAVAIAFLVRQAPAAQPAAAAAPMPEPVVTAAPAAPLPMRRPPPPQVRSPRPPRHRSRRPTSADASLMVPDADDPSFVDAQTGLFNEQYFRVAVESRVLAARRHLRPVAVVLFAVVEEGDDGDWAIADPAPVAEAIRDTLREADTACRLDDGRFGFVLEDTPEDGAIWTVERVRRALSSTEGLQTRWAGVACYPAHAFSAEEAMTKAEQAFHQAKEWAQDRIEVALPD
jgi:diguanylate cyclase (GGDEF)-like protein